MEKGKGIAQDFPKKKKNKPKWQVRILENAFTVTERPDPEIKAQLAEMTGLTVQQVQSWFGNRRNSRHRPRPGQDPGQSSKSQKSKGQKNQCSVPQAQQNDWRRPVDSTEVVLPPLLENGERVTIGMGVLQTNQPIEISEDEAEEQGMGVNTEHNLLEAPPVDKPMICYTRRNRKSTNMASFDLNEPYIDPNIPSSSTGLDGNRENNNFGESFADVPPGFEELYATDVKFRRARALRYIIRSHERRQREEVADRDNRQQNGDVQPILIDSDSDSE